jgi:phage host-nuclease inhibitor protein Gam
MSEQNNTKPKRKFTAAALIVSSEDAMIALLNRYVELGLNLAKRQAVHAARIAKLNSDFDEAAQADREELAMLESSVQLYCVNHREQLFSDNKKSQSFANATIGFRDNPPSVGKRIKRDSFEAIALRLDALSWGEKYVEWKASIRKDALLRDRAQLTEAQQAAAGIRFDQEEVFYIDPSAEAIERSKKPVEEIREVAAS